MPRTELVGDKLLPCLLTGVYTDIPNANKYKTEQYLFTLHIESNIVFEILC